MNWRCLIGHNWEYKSEEITFVRRKSGSHLQDTVIVPTKVRLCQRCYKKQRTKGIDWVDWELTKEEERDFKLKSIGV